MKAQVMHKRRTGHWCSMGNGSTQSGAEDPTDDDPDDDDDGSTQNKDRDPEKQRLIAENKKRRQMTRKWRERAEAAEARLSQDGKEITGTSADSIKAAIKLASAISKSGLKADRIDAALRLIDPDLLDDPEDALADLREAHPFLFDDKDDEREPTGRTAPSMNNGRKRLNQESDQQRKQRLAKKFPALYGRM